MKKLCTLLFVVVVLCFGLCSCGADPATEIVGSWARSYSEGEEIFVFENDNTGALYTNGEMTGVIQEWSYDESNDAYEAEYQSLESDTNTIFTFYITEDDETEKIYYDLGNGLKFEYTRAEE